MTISAELAAEFAAFDAAEQRGDAMAMKRHLDRAKQLTAGGQRGVGTIIAASTMVQRPDVPRDNVPTQLGERCHVCRLAFMGSKILPVKVSDGSKINACWRCRERRRLTPA